MKRGAKTKLKDSRKKLLILMSVILVLSLIVDLFSLNLLYNLKEDGSNLAGELAMSADAYFCVEENCNSEQYCSNKGFAEMVSCVNENCWDASNRRIKTETAEAYQECLDSCQIEGEYEKNWCIIERNRCVEDCEEQYPEENNPPTPIEESIMNYYQYYSSQPA